MRDVQPEYYSDFGTSDGCHDGGDGEGGTWWSRARVAQEWDDITLYLAALRMEDRVGAEGRRWALLMGELGLGRM